MNEKSAVLNETNRKTGKIRPLKRLTEQEKSLILELKSQGMSNSGIGRKLGKSRNTIRSFLLEHKLEIEVKKEPIFGNKPDYKKKAEEDEIWLL